MDNFETTVELAGFDMEDLEKKYTTKIDQWSFEDTVPRPEENQNFYLAKLKDTKSILNKYEKKGHEWISLADLYRLLVRSLKYKKTLDNAVEKIMENDAKSLLPIFDPFRFCRSSSDIN